MYDVKKLIKQNSELMGLLKIIHSFQLNDCWLCAGTLRNYIWDYLSTGNTSSNINFSDIDVIFFDNNISYEQTVEIENQIKQPDKQEDQDKVYDFYGIKDNQKFYLDDSKIVIYFDLYEIAPYAAGIPEFPIITENIKNQLKEEYIELLK